jgi:hypothetical protein
MPEDPFKQFWNLLVAFLLVYVITWVPISVCFLEAPEDGEMNLGEIFSLVVDCLFFIDIIVNFISAIQTVDGDFIVGLKEIAYNYITGWFFIDFIAVFPTNQLESLMGSSDEG